MRTNHMMHCYHSRDVWSGETTEPTNCETFTTPAILPAGARLLAINIRPFQNTGRW